MNISSISPRRWAALLLTVLLMLSLTPAALADTDENTPRITKQPDQLVLQLGTRWAGVEFELRTDAGKFPVPVVVDETGVLTMDLGGSSTYTLSPAPRAGSGTGKGTGGGFTRTAGTHRRRFFLPPAGGFPFAAVGRHRDRRLGLHETPAASPL